ncbi:MAG: hypothetical protein JOY61_14900 [Chloroflexi bacterium]|nr:hypothetical protein [Chloroflexota bacterium]
MSVLEHNSPNVSTGSLDREGAGDHDQPYRFGFRPRVSHPYPFSTRQYARLLILRGRICDSQDFSDRRAATAA